MFILPMSGLSEVMGMMTCTVLRKMVMDRRMVTPAHIIHHQIRKYICLNGLRTGTNEKYKKYFLLSIQRTYFPSLR